MYTIEKLLKLDVGVSVKEIEEFIEKEKIDTEKSLIYVGNDCIVFNMRKIRTDITMIELECYSGSLMDLLDDEEHSKFIEENSVQNFLNTFSKDSNDKENQYYIHTREDDIGYVMDIRNSNNNLQLIMEYVDK